jgi:hypothetical protein
VALVEEDLEKEGVDGVEKGLGRGEGAPVGPAPEKVQEAAREVPVSGAREKGLGLEGEAVEVVLEVVDQVGVALVGPHPDIVKIQNLPILRKPKTKDTRGKSCYRWRFFRMAG